MSITYPETSDNTNKTKQNTIRQTLTDAIEQLPAGRVLQKNVLNGALRPLAKVPQYMRILQDLLDAHLLLHRIGGVRMLLQVDHFHGDRLAGLPVQQQLHSVGTTNTNTQKTKMRIRFGTYVSVCVFGGEGVKIVNGTPHTHVWTAHDTAKMLPHTHDTHVHSHTRARMQIHRKQRDIKWQRVARVASASTQNDDEQLEQHL